MDTFKTLALVFDNCDETMFSWSDIPEFAVSGVRETHMKQPNGDLVSVLGFDEAYIEINKNANRAHFLFGTVETAESEFRYLTHAPIAQIVVEQNGESITYCLNESQLVHTSVVGGNLILRIK